MTSEPVKLFNKKYFDLTQWR